MPKTILQLNNFPDEGSVQMPIPAVNVDYDERVYLPSDFESFQRVFHKDNMPTYHQQYDNFLHWIWNEFGNDSEKFDSEEYHSEVLEKIAIFINARVLGVVNTMSNHAEILALLEKVVTNDQLDVFDHVAHVRSGLVDNKFSFNLMEDAVVWWRRTNSDINVRGYVPKPNFIPRVIIGPHSFEFPKHLIREFYEMIFGYTMNYYAHLYSQKFTPAWMKVDENAYVFAVKSNVKIEDQSLASFHDLIAGKEERDDFSIISGENLIQLKDLVSGENELSIVYLSSINGQLNDPDMNPYTIAYVAKTADGYYVSAQRGYDVFDLDPLGVLHRVDWMNTLAVKNRNEEAILTKVWKDVMQCNAVLFQTKEDDDLTIPIRITHYEKYANVCLNLGLADRIKHVDEMDGWSIAYLILRDIKPLVDIWKTMEHTMDLWVGYMDECRNDAWSLISNLYKHDVSFYHDKPHLVGITGYNGSIPDSGEVIAVVPRDGMCWSLGEDRYNFIPLKINGEDIRKIYR